MEMLGWSLWKAWTCCFSQGFSLLSMRMNQMSFTWACGRVASRLDAYVPCPISGTSMARAATTKDKRFIAPESFPFADSHVLSRLGLPLDAVQTSHLLCGRHLLSRPPGRSADYPFTPLTTMPWMK